MCNFPVSSVSRGRASSLLFFFGIIWSGTASINTLAWSFWNWCRQIKTGRNCNPPYLFPSDNVYTEGFLFSRRCLSLFLKLLYKPNFRWDPRKLHGILMNFTTAGCKLPYLKIPSCFYLCVRVWGGVELNLASQFLCCQHSRSGYTVAHVLPTAPWYASTKKITF